MAQYLCPCERFKAIVLNVSKHFKIHVSEKTVLKCILSNKSIVSFKLEIQEKQTKIKSKHDNDSLVRKDSFLSYIFPELYYLNFWRFES